MALSAVSAESSFVCCPAVALQARLDGLIADFRASFSADTIVHTFTACVDAATHDGAAPWSLPDEAGAQARRILDCRLQHPSYRPDAGPGAGLPAASSYPNSCASSARTCNRYCTTSFSAGGAVSLAFAAVHGQRLLSLALVEPAWAGNEGLAPEEKRLWLALRQAMTLPVPDRMAQFQRLHLRTGVRPPPPSAEPSPPWAARRPRALPVLVDAFLAHDLDLDRLRTLRAPVYPAVGALNDPDYFARQAQRLARTFGHCSVEVYDQRHHFDPPHRAEPARIAAGLQRLWTLDPALRE